MMLLRLLAALLVIASSAAAAHADQFPSPSQSTCNIPASIPQAPAPVAVSVIVRDFVGAPIDLADVTVNIVLLAGTLDAGQILSVNDVTDASGDASPVFPNGIAGKATISLEVSANSVTLCTSGPLTVGGIPMIMSYQGLLLDIGGDPVPTSNYDISFAIYNVESGGSPLWMELHEAVPVANGVFSVLLGDEGTPLALPFDEQYWLGITVGVGSELDPRVKLAASPYAMNAKIANGAITTPALADAAITDVKIADGAITKSKLAPGAINASTIGDGAVGTSELADNAVTSTKILDGAVTSAKILNNAVTGAKILDGTVTASDLAANSVGSSEIAANAVGSSELVEDVDFGGATGDGRVDVVSQASSIAVVRLAVTTAGSGTIEGRAGDASLTYIVGTGVSGDYGLVSVMNAAGTTTVQLQGNDGDVLGSEFVVYNPVAGSGDELVSYSSIHGPEAAVYVRGQAQLVGGRAAVRFPDHFRDMASPSTVTISLTPRSGSSRGVAAEGVTVEGMEVVELGGGTGTYMVDYVAYGERRGRENRRVYLQRAELMNGPVEAVTAQAPSEK